MKDDAPTPAQLPEQHEQTGHSADSKLRQSPHGAKALPSQQLDVLIVDAGSGDASVAMSCPPAAFLEPEFLQHAKEVLKGKGMLVVNCVSRAAEPYKAAVKALQVGCLLTDAQLKPCKSNLAQIMQTMQSMDKSCICSNAYAYESQPQEYYSIWTADLGCMSSMVQCVICQVSTDSSARLRDCCTLHL